MKIDLINAMKEAVKVLGNYPSEKISLFHHNDTDGLCSGTILMNAFEQSGYTVSRYSLEKPYPQVLSKIFHQSGQIIVFTDFAGKIAPLISRLNEGRNLVLILDHHPAETTDDPTVFNLDVELFGLKGDRDISASATCYLFAEVLLEDSEALRQKSAHLGVLGAIGDGFLVDGALSGVNRELMEIAQEQRTLRIRTMSGERSISSPWQEWSTLPAISATHSIRSAGWITTMMVRQRGYRSVRRGLMKRCRSMSGSW